MTFRRARGGAHDRETEAGSFESVASAKPDEPAECLLTLFDRYSGAVVDDGDDHFGRGCLQFDRHGASGLPGLPAPIVADAVVDEVGKYLENQIWINAALVVALLTLLVWGILPL